MKINDDGELEVDWEGVEEMAKKFDAGEKSEEHYRAKMLTIIFDMGYEKAIEDMEEESKKMLFMLSGVGGNA